MNKGAGVKVAVLDTGIDLDHPDLKVAGSVSFVQGVPSADDDNGHGTLVAGIIGAIDNGLGVVGVAPEAEIYAVKVLNQYGRGNLSDVVAGINWAVEHHMHVINVSIASPVEWPQSAVDALKRAYDSGIVIVAGAGNGGTENSAVESIWSPARYTTVISVGAIDKTYSRLSNSSTGAALELSAPGVDILSTDRRGGYTTISCTSASAPHVSGLAALIIASGITSNVEVRQALRDMAQDLGEPGWDLEYGWGLVDAKKVPLFYSSCGQ
jgi:subtilisin family serine protease